MDPKPHAPNEPKPRMSLKEHLLWLKESFRYEIPARVIHSNDRDSGYKVRRNWFQGVAADLANALTMGEIKDEEIRKEVEKFVAYAVSDEFAAKDLTEPSDIEWANRIIDMAVQKFP